MRVTALIATLLVALVSTTAVTWAQPATGVRRVVVLSTGVNTRSAPFWVAFEERLRELGWVDGQSMALEFLAPGPGESLARLAAAATRRHVDVLVAAGPEASARAAKDATATVPVVMVAINYDPVARGYVASLARPGGNMTGVVYRQLEVGAKQLELLAQLLPRRARIGVLWEPDSVDQLQAVESAARALGTALQKVEVPPPHDYEAAFRRLQHARAEGVLVLGTPATFRERQRIAQLALRHRLPSAAGSTNALDSAFLIGYGPDLNGIFRRAADYVDRVLKGAAPAQLPVEQPTKFDLVVNLKTARALGLTVPPSLLVRADRVIE